LSLGSSRFSLSASKEAPTFVDETVGNNDAVAGGRTADGWALEDSGVLAILGGIGTDGGGGGSSSVVAGGIAGAAFTACGSEGRAADSAAPTMPDAMGTGFKFAASVTIDVLAASAEPGVLAILGELRTDVGGGGLMSCCGRNCRRLRRSHNTG
jgi:hypothetical protein